MTARKRLKRLVRARAAKTGESYTAALRNLSNRKTKEPAMPTEPTVPDEPVKCSFCGKPQQDVRRLIAGPGVYICNECVELSVAIMAPTDEEKADFVASARARTRPDAEVEAKIKTYLAEAFERIAPGDQLSYPLARSIEVNDVEGRITVNVHTARPGLVIGRRGTTADELRSGLMDLAGGPVSLNITQVKPQPELQ